MRLARKVNELDQAEGAILAALRDLHEAPDFLRLVMRAEKPVAAADASRDFDNPDSGPGFFLRYLILC